MSEHSRIYARTRPSLTEALTAHHVLAGHVYLFARDEKIMFARPAESLAAARSPMVLWQLPSPRGLTVVKVPDALWYRPAPLDEHPTKEEIAAATEPTTWPSVDETPTPLDVFLADRDATKLAPWVKDVAPPSAVLRWLRHVARTHRVPIAWYYRLERGDDLYQDFAVIFEAPRETALVHTTFLGGGEMGRISVTRHGIDREARFDWVLCDVWKALGSPSGPAYFPPDDTAGFDWESRRAAHHSR